MLPKSLDRSAMALLATILAIGLAIGIGCSSTPEADETEPTMEPTEEMEPSDDPYAEPQQEPQQPPAGAEQPGDPMAPEAAEVDDEQLNKFADVVVATAELEQEIEQRMREVETQEEAQQVEMEILAELEEEVVAAGLTMEEYGAIAEQLQYDPELGERLQTILEDRGEGHLLQQPGM